MGNLLRPSDAALAPATAPAALPTKMAQLLAWDAVGSARHVIDFSANVGGLWIDAAFDAPCMGFQLGMSNNGTIDTSGIRIADGTTKTQYGESRPNGAWMQFRSDGFASLRAWLLPYLSGGNVVWAGEAEITRHDAAFKDQYIVRLRAWGGDLSIQPIANGAHSVYVRGLVP
jgi:hypothetical protein